MGLFSVLLIGHLFGDFPFQTPTILRWKAQGGVWILPHLAVHAAVMMVLVENPLQHWPLLVPILVSHFVIDWLKVSRGCRVGDGLSFLADQSAHVLILWVVTKLAAVSSHQFDFEYLPIALALALMSAFFMFLNVTKGQIGAIPAARVVGRYAFYISKAAGWSAVFTLLLSVPFLR